MVFRQARSGTRWGMPGAIRDFCKAEALPHPDQVVDKKYRLKGWDECWEDVVGDVKRLARPRWMQDPLASVDVKELEFD